MLKKSEYQTDIVPQLNDYMLKSMTQTVSAQHNFTNGLQINGVMVTIG